MKLTANLSIDLDDKWAYLRAAGRSDWAERSSYLPIVVPRIIEMMNGIELPLTVFVVGRDLEDSGKIDCIKNLSSIPEHEFANHSYNHLPWLHTMTNEEIEFEIRETSRLIEQHLRTRPRGFRGPGFSCPSHVLEVLASQGFHYDASLFPTSIAPIARAVFLMKSGLSDEQREKASKLYGGWNSAFQPNRPFRRADHQSRLWELPVTTMPIARTPIHFSYLTYLASFSTIAAKAYFRKAIWMCRLTRTSPSLLLHPPDFLGKEDDSDMSYFPAMSMSYGDKHRFVRWALQLYAESFEVKTMLKQTENLAGQTAGLADCRLT
jgi:peptidoglycan/xylan/chitin deacetylase (PgdA/CDA1 family)